MQAEFDSICSAKHPVSFELAWKPAAPGSAHSDLDIGCMYVLTDGTRGVVQSVGGLLGSRDCEPYIVIPRNTRDGHDSAGELLVMSRPDRIAFAVIFASIYTGTSDFRGADARLVINSPGLDVGPIHLRSPDPGLRWCAIAVCGSKEGRFLIRYQHRYFLSARHADDHYGIGLDWGIGLKRSCG